LLFPELDSEGCLEPKDVLNPCPSQSLNPKDVLNLCPSQSLNPPVVTVSGTSKSRHRPYRSPPTTHCTTTIGLLQIDASGSATPPSTHVPEKPIVIRCCYRKPQCSPAASSRISVAGLRRKRKVRRREYGRRDQVEALEVEAAAATGVIYQEDSGIIGNSELEDPDEAHVMEEHEVHGDQLELHRRGSRFRRQREREKQSARSG